jgi:DNA repair protein RecN (Recombination protein N)
MLALELAEIGEAPPQTLVFDEIDAGIGGGRVADRLGERLATLGARHQVLVVTHLPQIAARAGSHFRVSKRRDAGRARVAVDLLDDDARVEELARMLGGVEVTESVRQHARDLLGAS